MTAVVASNASGTVVNGAVVTGGGIQTPATARSQVRSKSVPRHWKRPHAGEGARRERRPHAGATSHLYPQGDERRRLADKRYRHRDGDPAGGSDRHRALRLRLDLQRRHADVHACGCARPVDELPRHHGDSEYRTRRGGHARQQRGGIRRRGFEHRQQHGYKSDHHQSTPSPDLACLVRDCLDECAARDRAFGLACTSFGEFHRALTVNDSWLVVAPKPWAVAPPGR